MGERCRPRRRGRHGARFRWERMRAAVGLMATKETRRKNTVGLGFWRRWGFEGDGEMPFEVPTLSGLVLLLITDPDSIWIGY